jgi:hypothetical protein
MDQTEALKEIDAFGPASPLGRTALAALIRTGAGGPAILERLDQALEGPVARTATDVALVLAHAQACWIADQRDADATRARDSAQRLIELVPDLADGYRLLGFAQLSRGAYREAVIALTALKAIPNAGNFDNFRALARHLMLGMRQIGFELDGERYTFDLTCHNAAATESSAFHSVGALTEWDELQYLRSTLPRPQRIVEVGVLLGNHTAFFLKTFAPTHMTLIDADPANITFIRRTAACNLPARPAPDIVIQCAFVGGRAGTVTFAGADVPQRPLADLVAGPVDFLKIDVDGGEVALLAGADAVIETHRPAVMIETTPATHDPVCAWFQSRRYDMRRVFDHGSHRNVVFTPAAS